MQQAAELGVALDITDRRVGDHREVLEHPVGSAVGGQVARTRLNRLPWRVVAGGDAVDVDGAGRGGHVTGDQRHHVLAAAAGDAGDADDLAAVQLQVEGLDVAARHSLDLESDHVVDALRRADAQLDLVADHQLDEFAVIERSDIECGDPLAVAQDRHFVSDLEHLVEVVRHVEDCHAARLEQADGLEETLHIGAGQRGRRFVEHQEVGGFLPTPKGTSQGDRRLLRRGQGSDRCRDIEVVEPEIGQGCSRPVGLTLPVDSAAVRRGEAGAQGEVLDGGQGVDQTEVLVHEADAERLGGLAVAELQRCTVATGTEVGGRGFAGWLVVAGEDLDQRRLAGAVLPDERVGATGVDRQADVVQSDLSGEYLRQMLDRQQWLHEKPPTVFLPS